MSTKIQILEALIWLFVAKRIPRGSKLETHKLNYLVSKSPHDFMELAFWPYSRAVPVVAECEFLLEPTECGEHLNSKRLILGIGVSRMLVKT